MNKVWAFGSSHTAGSELGNQYGPEGTKQWLLKHTGQDSIDVFNSMKDKKVHKIQEKWMRDINYLATPELAYTGQICKKLNYELKCYAEPGGSFDRAFYFLDKNKDNIDWTNDIVIVELTPVMRYMTSPQSRDFMFAWLPNYHALKNAPFHQSMLNWYKGLILRIRTEFPKVKLIAIQDSDTDLDVMQISNADKCLMDIAWENYNSFRYVCRHYGEPAHEDFANYLIDNVL